MLQDRVNHLELESTSLAGRLIEVHVIVDCMVGVLQTLFVCYNRVK